MPDSDAATTFLGALWTGAPSTTAFALWFKPKRTTYTRVFEPKAAADAATIATTQAGGADVYVHVSLVAAGRDFGRQRPKAKDSVGIPGFWMDLDVQWEGATHTALPASLEDATGLADLIMPASLIVASGHGLQAWWLFDEPWLFYTEDDRDAGALAVAGWQARLHEDAAQRGWKLDSTQDLARLMRLPGTVNHKDQPVDVELMRVSESFDRADLLPHLAVVKARPPTPDVDEVIVQVSMNGDGPHPPMEKIDVLIEEQPKFALSWQRRKKKWTQSEYDMSLASLMAHAQGPDGASVFTEQEMFDTLWAHRLAGGDPNGKLDRKGEYAGRTRQLISKALADAQASRPPPPPPPAPPTAEQQSDDAAVELAKVAANPAPPQPIKTTALFSTLIGGPKIRELIQDGTDSEHARLRLVLEDGREVRIGEMDTLLRKDRFRPVWATATQHNWSHPIKDDKWQAAIAAMLRVATVNEGLDPDDQTREWIDAYLASVTTSAKDRDGAILTHTPFSDDEGVWLYAQHFMQWLRQRRGERVKAEDLYERLRSIGCERRALKVTTDDGLTTRSYWLVPS